MGTNTGLCQAQAIERIIGAIHTRGAARVEGATSTTAWLRNQLHIPTSRTTAGRQ